MQQPGRGICDNERHGSGDDSEILKHKSIVKICRLGVLGERVKKFLKPREHVLTRADLIYNQVVDQGL